jgi:hypothetical protein
MRDEKIDPSFRAFAETRPKYRRIWFRAYLGGLLYYPVGVTGLLVGLVPAIFGLGWGWLLAAVGLPFDGYFVWPVIAVWILVLIAMIWHTEFG